LTHLFFSIDEKPEPKIQRHERRRSNLESFYSLYKARGDLLLRAPAMNELVEMAKFFSGLALKKTALKLK
jgi:hypothetical protein